jgi:arylsulfatase A-like enzyme
MSHSCCRTVAAVLAAAITLGVAPPQLQTARAARRARPNILIIVTDDQRERTLKTMPRTHLWFKRLGVNFTQAYATTPLCCPSRASIFTGRYAHNHGVRDNRSTALLNHRTTLQRYLHRAGYRTAIFGKFLNGWEIAKPPPYFDEWATFASGRVPYYNGLWNDQGLVRTVAGYATDFIKRRAVRFLKRAESFDRRPWLMYLTPGAPHSPAIPEPAYAAAPLRRWTPNPAVGEEDRSDKPPYVQARHASIRWVRELRRRQLRSLMSVDEMVGRVFKVLKRLDDRRRTLAIYLSDNGFLWGEHGLTGYLGKRPPYTQAVKIPMLMRWPGRVTGGRVVTKLVANIDVAPTALAAAGVRPPPGVPLDGRRLIGGGSRSRLLLEYYMDGDRAPEWASNLTASNQYVEYYEEDSTTVNFREYYDLADDPWSLSNLLFEADDDDLNVELLHARLAADRLCRGRACP